MIVVDDESKNSYKIPNNLEAFDGLLKISLRDRCDAYIKEVSK